MPITSLDLDRSGEDLLVVASVEIILVGVLLLVHAFFHDRERGK
jgi:hypothetical protein